MARILVIHGPNLNLLGTRELEIYGKVSLAEINQAMVRQGEKLGCKVECIQSNSEGEIIDIIHSNGLAADCIIINPAAYTHYSIAIRDALKAVSRPVVEVHLSNIYAREEFRHTSVIAPVAVGQVSGFGPYSYQLAVFAAVKIINPGLEV